MLAPPELGAWALGEVEAEAAAGAMASIAGGRAGVGVGTEGGALWSLLWSLLYPAPAGWMLPSHTPPLPGWMTVEHL